MIEEIIDLLTEYVHTLGIILTIIGLLMAFFGRVIALFLVMVFFGLLIGIIGYLLSGFEILWGIIGFAIGMAIGVFLMQFLFFISAWFTGTLIWMLMFFDLNRVLHVARFKCVGYRPI